MKRFLILLFFATSTMPALPAHAQGCTLHTLSKCDNTNQLIWDQAFDDAMAAFIGDRPAGWLYEDGTMLGQVRAVLGGGADKPVYFSQGLVRFSACRHHSCDEKGAVVLTTEGEIVAVGVIHFDVSREYSGHRMLTILTRKRDDRFQEVADHLVAWHEKVVTDYNNWLKERYGLPDTSEKLGKMRDPEIVLLTGPTVPEH
ncbi:hypothetical protein AQ1_02393 [alpha proteobacterium Q-1]|nr:hypothetical protein AQ1_02393 [alpha proteobacterium Q-1]